jgi:hypothetical protein
MTVVRHMFGRLLCRLNPIMRYNAAVVAKHPSVRGWYVRTRSHPAAFPRLEDRKMGITTDVVTVLHPAAEDVAEPQRLAPRLSNLQGRTVGLIDNHKRNADIYLEELGRLLQERYGASQVVTYRKISQSLPTPDAILDHLASTCDAVIHAVAD